MDRFSSAVKAPILEAGSPKPQYTLFAGAAHLASGLAGGFRLPTLRVPKHCMFTDRSKLENIYASFFFIFVLRGNNVSTNLVTISIAPKHFTKRSNSFSPTERAAVWRLASPSESSATLERGLSDSSPSSSSA